ncbi:MAG: hypothetical protein ACRBEQ_12855 [Hyphomonas sp.]
MKYYIDCEFNGFGGELLTLALAGEDGRDLSLSRPIDEIRHLPLVPWVRANVLPKIDIAPVEQMPKNQFGYAIAKFLRPDLLPTIVADWPEDLKHFCDSLSVAPGEVVTMPEFRMEITHTLAYPTSLENAVRHNALWDARALRHAANEKAISRAG